MPEDLSAVDLSHYDAILPLVPGRRQLPQRQVAAGTVPECTLPPESSWEQYGVLACSRFPVLGALALRYAPSPEDAKPLRASLEAVELEGVAFTVASFVQNARLYWELLRSERFREDLLRNMANGLLALDREGRVTAFNRQAEKLTGFDASAVVGRCEEELPPLVRSLVRQAARVLRSERDLPSREIALFGADGSKRPVSLAVHMLPENLNRNPTMAPSTETQ